MEFVYSKKKKRKGKRKFKKYWRLLEPESYVNLMTKEYSGKVLIKLAKDRLRDVPLKGIIKQTSDGFVYVEVSNDVIHGLFSLIDEARIEKPPYFGKSKKKIGAHISFINEDELKEYEIEDIEEVGQEVGFKLGEMKSVEPKDWEGIERVWFVEIESQELEDIRKKYGLPKTYKNKGECWHITCAVRKKKK